MQLLKFYATWCGPCKMLSKTMEDIQFPYEVIPVDIDENMELAVKYSVRGVPALILIDEEGNPVTSSVGLLSKKDLEAKFLTS
jgi:thioredoxin 1